MIEDRRVSFLELFYDLVYVVLIGQLAHTLAEDVSWSGVLDFAVVFGLIWIGWFNGTEFHELHGREDGRNRSFIFFRWGSSPSSPSSPGTLQPPTGGRSQSRTRSCSRSFSGRVRRREHRQVMCLEVLDHRRPEGGVGRAALHENHRRRVSRFTHVRS